MTPHKRHLPLGLQTLSEIITTDCYYADKTPFIHRLIAHGKYYFLSRPRRFGKSLLLDTLKELFEGNRALFTGLFIEDKWDWAQKYPVVRFSFGGGTLKSRSELDARIISMLTLNAKMLGLTLREDDDIPGKFMQILMHAQEALGKNTVLLIDEYDKPILDNITQPELAREMREGLKNLYSCIKDAAALLKFCLLTGVSKFSKVSLFSGLNNLTDITLDPHYSAICGYTDNDIDTLFAPELQGFDREELRRWYNGYNWLGTCVYNPFDVLLLFAKQKFGHYWFETATPTFLVDLLQKKAFFTPNLASQFSDYELLGQFDVDNIAVEALLFQTGYLTIKSVEEPIPAMTEYELSYPNFEVEVSLNKALLPALGLDMGAVTRTRRTVVAHLTQLNFNALKTHFQSLLASIPHDWYRNNPLQNYEGHYASIFYSHFAALGLHVHVEAAVSTGKVDMVITFNQTVFLFEFKVVENDGTGAALAQIKHKNYAQKYRALGYPIYLIGVEFSKMQKSIVGFEVEQDC